jgi:glycosyltransferase involved in cell wall biosynthesis
VIVGHGFDTIREVLTDGVDAYLSNPDIEEELAEKLRIAIDSDSSEIGERARQKAFSQYSWQNRATLIFDSLPSQYT